MKSCEHHWHRCENPDRCRCQRAVCGGCGKKIYRFKATDREGFRRWTAWKRVA